MTKSLNFCANFLSLSSGAEGWMYVFPRPFDYYANQLLWEKTEIIDHGGFAYISSEKALCQIYIYLSKKSF